MNTIKFQGEIGRTACSSLIGQCMDSKVRTIVGGWGMDNACVWLLICFVWRHASWVAGISPIYVSRTRGLMLAIKGRSRSRARRSKGQPMHINTSAGLHYILSLYVITWIYKVEANDNKAFNVRCWSWLMKMRFPQEKRWKQPGYSPRIQEDASFNMIMRARCRSSKIRALSKKHSTVAAITSWLCGLFWRRWNDWWVQPGFQVLCRMSPEII